MHRLFGVWMLSIMAFYKIEMATGQTGAQAKALRKKLFVTDEYDYRVRPLYQQDTYIEVNLDFYLLAINSLDEVSETLKTTGFIEIVWTDEFLTWNATEWGGIEASFWPQNDVWKPDIALKNSYKEYKQLGVPSLNVEVWHDGSVKWMPFQVFESTCSIDIKYFPFDEQVCSLVFVAWTYTKHEIFVGVGAPGIVMDDFARNSQWDVTETWWSDVEIESESSVNFHMKLKRKPLYDILTMVFPVLLLGLLNILVFTIPCESGEKAGYSITVFLSFAVFLTIVESSFPRNSETVAYFAIYVIIQTAQSTMITLLSLLMIKCNHFDDSVRIPSLIIVLAKLGRFRFDTIKCEIKKRNAVCQSKEEDEAQKGMSRTYETGVGDSCNDLRADDQSSDETYTWNWAMNGLDNLLLMLYTCVLISVTLWCMLAAYNGK